MFVDGQIIISTRFCHKAAAETQHRNHTKSLASKSRRKPAQNRTSNSTNTEVMLLGQAVQHASKWSGVVKRHGESEQGLGWKASFAVLLACSTSGQTSQTSPQGGL